MKLTYILIILSFISVSCNQVDSSIDKGTSHTIGDVKNQSISSELIQETKNSNAQKTNVEESGPNNTITFDNITLEEIKKNNASDGGNNLKEPLVFNEAGMQVKISNVFFLQADFGNKLPNFTAPNSLSGAIIMLDINDGEKFNFTSAMITSMSTPKKVKIQGIIDGEAAFEERLELKNKKFKKFDFDFKNIESLIIWGGIDGAVLDNLEISLN